jgi:Mce-associated membrane protein
VFAVATVAVIFVAALGLSGVLFWKLKQRDDTAAAGKAALQTAKTYAVTLSSVDTKDLDKNFAQVLDGATGEFKDMYSQSSAQLRQLLIDNKAASLGVVIDAGIKSATPTKVDVLLFVDQSISNTARPEPRVDRLRITMTMDRVDGRWLASHVEIS